MNDKLLNRLIGIEVLCEQLGHRLSDFTSKEEGVWVAECLKCGEVARVIDPTYVGYGNLNSNKGEASYTTCRYEVEDGYSFYYKGE